MVPLAVFIGGGLGALTRYGAGVWLRRTSVAAFPWSTFVVNVVGCLLLGFLAVWLTARTDSAALKVGVTTGFLGGLTTFSTFGVETVQLFSHGQYKLGLAYLGGNVGLGILAAVAGMALGARV